MTPNSRRLLATAAAHRRSVATSRWFAFMSGLSTDATRGALMELGRTGHVSRRASESIYDIHSYHVDDEPEA